MQLLLAALAAVTLWLYWSTPYSADNVPIGAEIRPWIGQAFRYGLPFVAILAVMASVGFSSLPARYDLLLEIAACVLGWSSLRMVFHDSAPVIALGAALVIIALTPYLKRKIMPLTRRRVMPAIVVGAIVLIAVAWSGAIVREQGRRSFFALTAAIDGLPEDDSIGYTATNLSYPFHGSTLWRRLVYLPSKSDSYEEWLKSIRKAELRYIGAGVVIGADPARELRWMLEHPEAFKPIESGADNKGPYLFEFHP